MEGIITKVDEYFTKSKTTMPYPNIVIESKYLDALPIIMESLEEGDISVIFKYNEKFVAVKKKISRSALTLARLLSVYDYTLSVNKDNRVTIRSNRDILEVRWMD